MSVSFDDVTVHWGRAPDPMDQQTRRWRQAVFQDLAISEDSRLLFFLYDPEADENSGTTGARKGNPCIVIFDTNMRCFVREIQLSLRPQVEGVPKFMFMLDGLNSGQPKFVVCTEVEHGYDKQMNIYQALLTPDGMNLASQLIPIFGPVPVGDDWIVCMREDLPEIVLLTGPGLTVWRINVRAPGAAPVDTFSVPDAQMSRYYDAFVWRGKVYLLAATPQENFDFSHLQLLDLSGRGAILSMPTKPDPQRGFPPNRKQTGMDMTQGRIFVTGGEYDDNMSGVRRFNDVWWLDLTDFEWKQVPAQLPLPLIEPRLTTAPSGVFHVWGDCDLATGCVAPPTHLHIIKVTGAPVEPPPSYQAAAPPPGYPSTTSPPPADPAPPYPQQSAPPYPQQSASPYPQQSASPYPQQSASPYPPQGGYPPQQAGYPTGNQPPPQYPPQGGGYPPQQGYPPQGAPPQYPAQGGYPPQSGYPPQQQAYYPQGQGGKKNKDCCIS